MYIDSFVSVHSSNLFLSNCFDCFQEFDLYKDYKKLMSTVFTLLGANATTVDQKVKRIVELEEDFILGVGKFLNIHL